MKRELKMGDKILVPMIVVGFESQGPGRKKAIMVKLPHSGRHIDHRLTRSQIQLDARLKWDED